jgi:5-methylcytosine-specific restriction protein A
MTVDELLNGELDTLLATFFNARKNRLGDFEVSSKWMKQLKYEGARRYDVAATNLTAKYGMQFEAIGQVEIAATIANPNHLEVPEFLESVYFAIVSKLATLPAGYPLDMEMALALFIFRGSPDTSLGMYSLDLLHEEVQSYVDNFQALLLSSDDLLSRLNLNFRDLQPQFVAGTNRRNAQVRINLKWFYENVVVPNSNLNPYKYEALKHNFKDLGEVRTYPSFENRLVFFRSKVLGRELSPSEIATLREDLKIAREDAELVDQGKFTIRNQKIIAFARETYPDVCVGCEGLYPVESRTFLMPRNNRFYFEVNHVIAYSNDSSAVDVLQNLVKLCATCHRALTPRRAHEQLQKSIIEKMLASRPEVLSFVKSMAQKTGETPLDFVFKRLK